MKSKKYPKNVSIIIPNETIRKYSGDPPALHRAVEALKRTHYYVVMRPIMGDAPKNFIYVYEFRRQLCRREQPKTWIPYIAKVGHKWYPNESITEYLMVRIGETLNLTMAKSRLAIINGQLRFLSQFFLTKNEVLNHGAEIFSNYLCDPEFIAQIGLKREEQKWFTFQFIEAAIRANFAEQADHFLKMFVKLLAFDAITGNNDRHHYNWGIITSIVNDNYVPRFAPIYDTARGLFWSTSDAQIKIWLKDEKQLFARIRKYAENAKPQTGWENFMEVNHFQLIERLVQDKRFLPTIQQLCSPDTLQHLFTLMDTEFINLMQPPRRNLIKQYIQYRFERLQTIIHPQN